MSKFDSSIHEIFFELFFKNYQGILDYNSNSCIDFHRLQFLNECLIIKQHNLNYPTERKTTSYIFLKPFICIRPRDLECFTI